MPHPHPASVAPSRPCAQLLIFAWKTKNQKKKKKTNISPSPNTRARWGSEGRVRKRASRHSRNEIHVIDTALHWSPRGVGLRDGRRERVSNTRDGEGEPRPSKGEASKAGRAVRTRERQQLTSTRHSTHLQHTWTAQWEARARDEASAKRCAEKRPYFKLKQAVSSWNRIFKRFFKLKQASFPSKNKNWRSRFLQVEIFFFSSWKNSATISSTWKKNIK